MNMFFWLLVIFVVCWIFNAFDDENRKSKGLEPRRQNQKAAKSAAKTTAMLIKWGMKK